MTVGRIWGSQIQSKADVSTNTLLSAHRLVGLPAYSRRPAVCSAGSSATPVTSTQSNQTDTQERRDSQYFASTSGATLPAQAGTHARLGSSSTDLRIADSNSSAAADESGNESAGSSAEYWQDLLSAPEETAFGSRARSASDSGVLRRKGHLKEQDKMIEFMLRMHETHTCLEVMQKMEKWIIEHQKDPKRSRLRRMVPTVGSFFTPKLRLVDALLEYDEFFALSRRRYIPPNFAELRHVLNIAQVHASVQELGLMTFDADGTLYADGTHMNHDNEMINHMITLMEREIHVAIVTAAGYPGDASRFEERVAGLLAAFKRRRLPPNITNRFHIVGGECNYLLRVDNDYRLRFVDDKEWKSECMLSWSEADIQAMLTDAQGILLDTAQHLRLPVEVVRKERAVGVIPAVPTVYEVLEEIVFTVQAQLVDTPMPFCAFNGGADVFVDVGNKSLGLESLMHYLNLKPSQVLHVGDRFTASGNDVAVRDCCSILWVANPEETDFFIKLLLHDLRSLRQNPYIE